MERETIDAAEFLALVDGVQSDEVFRERDEKATRGREKAAKDREKKERPAAQPTVPKPAHVNSVTPTAS